MTAALPETLQIVPPTPPSPPPGRPTVKPCTCYGEFTLPMFPKNNVLLSVIKPSEKGPTLLFTQCALSLLVQRATHSPTTCLCTPVQSLPSIHTDKSSANHLAATQWIHPRGRGEEASGRRFHAQPSQRAVEKSHRCFLGSYSSGCHVWCDLVILARTLKILPMPFFIASLFHFAGPLRSHWDIIVYLIGAVVMLSQR